MRYIHNTGTYTCHPILLVILQQCCHIILLHCMHRGQHCCDMTRNMDDKYNNSSAPRPPIVSRSIVIRSEIHLHELSRPVTADRRQPRHRKTPDQITGVGKRLHSASLSTCMASKQENHFFITAVSSTTLRQVDLMLSLPSSTSPFSFLLIASKHSAAWMHTNEMDNRNKKGDHFPVVDKMALRRLR